MIRHEKEIKDLFIELTQLDEEWERKDKQGLPTEEIAEKMAAVREQIRKLGYTKPIAR